MKEELIKEMEHDLSLVMDYNEYSEDCGYGDQSYIEFEYDKMAKELVDMGWAKPIWHSVSDGDLPTRQGQRVWLYTISGDYFMANYYDNTPIGGKQLFEMSNCARITLSDVIAWIELPKYKKG